MSRADNLVLIEGNGLICRGFFGSGSVEGAVRFYTSRINTYLDRQPRYIAVVMDAPGPTFRHDLFPGYKSNRGSTPDGLKKSFPACRFATDLIGIPVVQEEGVEADDAIGTLAAEGELVGLNVFVVSPDKDMYQLLSEKTSQVIPGKKNSHNWYTAKHFVEEFGISPEQWIDVLAIAGDKVDGIPGASGIGMKKALNLIREFGSVEGVIDNASRIKSKFIAGAISDSSELLPVYKQLTAIKRDVPISVSFLNLEMLYA